ncbi:MAG TPA: hypothetical protein PKE30_13645 [Niabella sp.]|nr:hypothetical protein [Niabella sp.]
MQFFNFLRNKVVLVIVVIMIIVSLGRPSSGNLFTPFFYAAGSLPPGCDKEITKSWQERSNRQGWSISIGDTLFHLQVKGYLIDLQLCIPKIRGIYTN